MSDDATLLQLRQSLGLLQVAFDASAEAMVIVEPTGQVRWGNQAAADLWTDGLAILLVGRPLEQLLQSLTTSSGLPLSVESAEHPLQRLKRGDGKGVYGIRELLQQLEWRCITQPDTGYLLLLARDLGPQEQALQEQRKFLNQLAHELNTPLAIVSGSLRQLAKKAHTLGNNSKKRLQQAQQETSRLGRLLRNLLVLTDLETGRRQLTLKPLALESWISRWCSLQDLPERAEIKLTPASGISSTADVDQEALTEVLAQLLENSLRFSSDPARIQLAINCVEGRVTLLWKDQGLGISTEQGHQVFDRFVRLEEHRHPSRPDGAGLGLAITEALMEAMEGSIHLAPQEAGSAGATFVLSWPQSAAK